jgi:predicted nucleic acid-binding protein
MRSGAEELAHRQVGPDLLVAATVELARLTVLHLDKDFDLIASITGQPVERF